MASLPPLQIAVTGAAGQIAYSLLPHICLGRTFGPNRNVQLRLLDIDRAQKALGGVKMELEDCGFDLLKGVTFTADPSVAFKDVDVVIMLGAFPRGPGMQRADLLAKNCNIFKQQGRLLNEIASKDVKVVVVGNPANTNAWVCAESAPNIPKTNFTALTRLDANRAQSQIAMRVGVPASKVEQALIWGNHSSTQYPDVTSAKVVGPSGKVPVKTAVNNDAYLQSEFIKTVQNRGAAVIDARKLSSAMSAAKAISDHMHDFICGSDGRVVSMAVPSDGSYDIQKGLMFSFPVICKPGGKYEIVQGLPVDSFSRTMLDETQKELVMERDTASGFLFKNPGMIARAAL